MKLKVSEIGYALFPLVAEATRDFHAVDIHLIPLSRWLLLRCLLDLFRVRLIHQVVLSKDVVHWFTAIGKVIARWARIRILQIVLQGTSSH